MSQAEIDAIYWATFWGNIWGNAIGVAIGAIAGIGLVTPIIKLFERVTGWDVPEIGE